MDYIINFQKYFKNPEIIKLNLNYRSTETIVNASNEVIKHNKYKIDKAVEAKSQSVSKINIYRAKQLNEDGIDYIVQHITALLNEGYSGEDIFILYRRSKMFWPVKEKLRDENLKIPGKTIHASKGLEAKVIFIIGLTEGSGGFPDIWQDDRIFQVIKKSNIDLLYEEERRLFYVALTRAREEVNLITEIGNESPFIDEIPAKYLTQNKINLNYIEQPLLSCENCKRQLRDVFSFCPYCGEKQ